MNAVVIPGSFGQVSKAFANQPVENELGAGIQGGFGLIAYKGKVWSIRKGGEDHPLMREDGDGPRNSIEIVVVKASGVVSKIFYKDGYVEGSTKAPDCYSTNGITPAAGATLKQCTTCAACPMNAWGSRITPAGKQGKACSDSKRLAVVPLGDLRNEAYGGPMLLRVPAASLSEMRTFGDKMAALGFPAGSYGMRIAFDTNEAYPKFVFSAIRPLDEIESCVILQLRVSPETARVLAEDEYTAPVQALPAPAPASPFEQPVQPAQPVGGVPSQEMKLNNVVPLQSPTTGAVSTPSAPTAASSGARSSTTPATQPLTAHVTAPPQMGPSAGGASTATAPFSEKVSPALQSISGAPEAAPTGNASFDSLLDSLLT